MEHNKVLGLFYGNIIENRQNSTLNAFSLLHSKPHDDCFIKALLVVYLVQPKAPFLMSSSECAALFDVGLTVNFAVVLCADWMDRITERDVLWCEREPDRMTGGDAIQFSGIPYMNLGVRILECCCGVMRHTNVSVSQ